MSICTESATGQRAGTSHFPDVGSTHAHGHHVRAGGGGSASGAGPGSTPARKPRTRREPHAHSPQAPKTANPWSRPSRVPRDCFNPCSNHPSGGATRGRRPEATPSWAVSLRPEEAVRGWRIRRDRRQRLSPRVRWCSYPPPRVPPPPSRGRRPDWASPPDGRSTSAAAAASPSKGKAIVSIRSHHKRMAGLWGVAGRRVGGVGTPPWPVRAAAFGEVRPRI